MTIELPRMIGNKREHARGERPDAGTGRGHHGYHDRGGKGAERNIKARAPEFCRCSAGAVAPAERNSHGEHHDVEQDGAERRPINQAKRGRGREPYDARHPQTQNQAVALRHRGIGGGEDGNGRVDGDAADGACGDEARRMFKGKDGVSGARRGRQCADQRTDKRTAPLNRQRRDDDNTRRQHHFEGKAVPEKEFERDGMHVPGNRNGLC